MSKHLKNLAIGATIAAGLAAAPVLYAQDYLSPSQGSMMGRGMMGQGGMMGQMSSMMESCNQMMHAMKGNEHGGQRPNEQWQERSPQQQDQPQSEHDAG
jgi:hypothetical protein